MRARYGAVSSMVHGYADHSSPRLIILRFKICQLFAFTTTIGLKPCQDNMYRGKMHKGEYPSFASQ